MAYKRRGRYWYRSERAGRHVRTHYIGAGAAGLLLAGLEAEDQAERAARRAAERAAEAQHREIEQAIAEHERLTRAAMAAALLAAGYHLHSRQWRRHRR